MTIKMYPYMEGTRSIVCTHIQPPLRGYFGDLSISSTEGGGLRVTGTDLDGTVIRADKDRLWRNISNCESPQALWGN
jgi:hypothetical protein